MLDLSERAHHIVAYMRNSIGELSASDIVWIERNKHAQKVGPTNPECGDTLCPFFFHRLSI